MDNLKGLRNLNIVITFSFLILLITSTDALKSIVSTLAFLLYMYISLDVDNDIYKKVSLNG